MVVPQMPADWKGCSCKSPIVKLTRATLTYTLQTCVFCPNTDGAFKLTHESRWSHLICAIWIPEVNLANATFMEPVMDVGSVPRQRWKLVRTMR